MRMALKESMKLPRELMKTIQWVQDRIWEHTVLISHNVTYLRDCLFVNEVFGAFGRVLKWGTHSMLSLIQLVKSSNFLIHLMIAQQITWRKIFKVQSSWPRSNRKLAASSFKSYVDFAVSIHSQWQKYLSSPISDQTKIFRL